MKKMIALLLVAAFILSCVPAMALDKKVTSDLLGTSVFVPENLELLAEFSSDDTDDIYMFFLMNDFSNLQINSSLLYKPEYLGMQTKDVPKEDIESWKEFFTASYPKRFKSTMLRPSYGGSQRIYRFYGRNKDGNWLLSYTGVKDGLYVCTSCETGQFGFRRNEMQMIFKVFNLSFQMFAESRGVDFVPFNPDDYEVEIFNLLYDDSPDSIFRSM